MKSPMTNIHNFANRQLCEYQSIFPTLASLLDHLLFTNGNGYTYDPERGMMLYHDGKKEFYINEYPAMTDSRWDKLIASCHAKEQSFAKRFAGSAAIDVEQLAADCAKYRRVMVDDSMFSEEELYMQLNDMARTKAAESFMRGMESFVRPYPLTPGYADVFRLDERTPGWFLQIAFNFCSAWVKFLDDEIKHNHVWVKPSLRPKREGDEFRQEAMAELIGMIKDDAGYDGWADRPEPEVDYADMDWTIKHRYLLSGEVQRLGKLLINSGNLSVGDRVVVKIRDPYYTYAGCAEPKPGMKCVVSDIAITEPAAFGKIAVKFEPETLGYEKREKDDSITLYLRPWILERV